MDNILKALSDHEAWKEFAAYKIDKGHLTKKDEEFLTAYVHEKRYLPFAMALNEGAVFSAPEIARIDKGGSSRKRTVFLFPEDENYMQKMISYQLFRYDHLFADNLYSFRKDMGVKKAIGRIFRAQSLGNKYSCRLDVSDYFNSVNPLILLPDLKKYLADDPGLYRIIRDMLLNPYALEAGRTVSVTKGILAGSPVSGFLANLYLADLDRFFEDKGLLYARYSDDIIFFTDDEKTLDEHIRIIRDFLAQRDLTVNEEKTELTEPGQPWTFLGFRYDMGTIDISNVSIRKLKKKMRRKADALRRWQIKKEVPPEKAVLAFIKHFNRKFYCNDKHHEITWCRWYFPVINTGRSLNEIDRYMQQCIRYIATGKHNKGQFNFSYDKMKALGYKTLVNSYYNYKDMTS